MIANPARPFECLSDDELQAERAHYLSELKAKIGTPAVRLIHDDLDLVEDEIAVRRQS